MLTSRSSVRGLLIASVVAAGIALAGCGGGDGGNASSSEDCAITGTGQKLCGDDLAAFCAKFANANDADTAQACGAVGDGTQNAECAAYSPGSPGYLDCVQRH